MTGSKRNGHIILVQDITSQAREESQRKEFVANVSHELKTPLTTIKTYTESLLDWGIEEKSRDRIKSDMSRVYDDTLRMEKLIDDLLLLSRIDGKGMYTRIEAGNLVSLVKKTVDRLIPQAEDKDIQLTCDIVSQVPKVYLDQTAMERIVTNLLTNAIKYTDHYGQVKVYVGKLVDSVYIKIKDNGLGIDREEQDHIFDRFYRVDTTGSRQYGGTGLGLSIVRELVDLHQGRVTVQSSLGRGSEFTVILPSCQKSLQNCVYEMIHYRQALNLVTQAAYQDLEQVCGKVNWQDLTANQEAFVLEKVNSLTA